MIITLSIINYIWKVTHIHYLMNFLIPKILSFNEIDKHGKTILYYCMELKLDQSDDIYDKIAPITDKKIFELIYQSACSNSMFNIKRKLEEQQKLVK